MTDNASIQLYLVRTSNQDCPTTSAAVRSHAPRTSCTGNAVVRRATPAAGTAQQRDQGTVAIRAALRSPTIPNPTRSPIARRAASLVTITAATRKHIISAGSWPVSGQAARSSRISARPARTSTRAGGALAAHIDASINHRITLHQPDDRRIVGVGNETHRDVGGNVDGRVLVNPIRMVAHVNDRVGRRRERAITTVATDVDLAADTDG